VVYERVGDVLAEMGWDWKVFVGLGLRFFKQFIFH